MKREIVLPAAAWAGGLAGFFLRRWEIAVAYDAQTKLMSPCVQTWLLVALMALLPAAFCALCRRALRDRPRGGQDGGAGSVYLALNAIGAFLLILAGILGLGRQSRVYPKSPIALLTYAACVVAGAAVIAAAGQIAHDRRALRFPILLMAPSFAALLWLIALYQQFARQPVLLLYLWQLLAHVAVVLSLYCMVSLTLGKGSAARVSWLSLWAISLTLTSLADGPSLLSLLFSAFALSYLTAQAYLLLRPTPEQPMNSTIPEESDDE